MLLFVYLFNLIVMTLRNKTWHKPKCRWNDNNFHSHDVKSVLLRILYFLCFSIATLSIKLFFLVHRKNYSLILNYIAKSCLFPLVAVCTSGEYLNGFSGFFTTPNLPSNYTQYSKCTWNITVPSGYIIKLSFVCFRLEPNQYSPCYYDAPGARVTVTNVASDDGYQPFMLCGQSLPPPVYSVGNSVQVIFTSLSSQYPGFNASYTAITYSSGTWYTLFITHQRLS